MKLPELPNGNNATHYLDVIEYGRQCAEAMREACAELLLDRDMSKGNPLTAYQAQYNCTVLHTVRAIRSLEIDS